MGRLKFWQWRWFRRFTLEPEKYQDLDSILNTFVLVTKGREYEPEDWSDLWSNMQAVIRQHVKKYH